MFSTPKIANNQDLDDADLFLMENSGKTQKEIENFIQNRTVQGKFRT